MVICFLRGKMFGKMDQNVNTTLLMLIELARDILAFLYKFCPHLSIVSFQPQTRDSCKAVEEVSSISSCKHTFRTIRPKPKARLL